MAFRIICILHFDVDACACVFTIVKRSHTTKKSNGCTKACSLTYTFDNNFDFFAFTMKSRQACFTMMMCGLYDMRLIFFF